MMKCPDCGEVDVIREHGQAFCCKCGLELDDLFISQGFISRKEKQGLEHTPRLDFMIDPRQEYFALKLGLKNNKLVKEWENLLGFRVKSLTPDLKKKAMELITKSIDNKKQLLNASRDFISVNWEKVHNRYFIEMEKLFFPWQSPNYSCFLSLVCNGGFHNSAKNFIIIQHKWREHSNYVIAHELFHIMFRNYVNRFFKEKYNDFDEDLSEAVVNIVLLDSSLKDLFPNLKFSFDIYALEKHMHIAEKIHGFWNNNMKEFLIKSYKVLGVEKTWISY